jgi:hypothetical protein
MDGIMVIMGVVSVFAIVYYSVLLLISLRFLGQFLSMKIHDQEKYSRS